MVLKVNSQIYDIGLVSIVFLTQKLDGVSYLILNSGARWAHVMFSGGEEIK